MRTITKITNVYEFEELSSDAKEHALDKYREWMTDDPYWYTCIEEDWKDKLSDLGIEKPEISFSGFYSQGDGAVFECKGIDLIKLMNNLGLQDKYRYVYDRVLDDVLAVSVGIHRTSTYHDHENTALFDLSFEQLNDDEFESYEECEETEGMIISMLSQLRIELEQWRIDTCKEIYQALEDEYTLLQSDDVLKETFIENEYEFTEDGEMFP